MKDTELHTLKTSFYMMILLPKSFSLQQSNTFHFVSVDLIGIPWGCLDYLFFGSSFRMSINYIRPGGKFMNKADSTKSSLASTILAASLALKLGSEFGPFLGIVGISVWLFITACPSRNDDFGSCVKKRHM